MWLVINNYFLQLLCCSTNTKLRGKGKIKPKPRNQARPFLFSTSSPAMLFRGKVYTFEKKEVAMCLLCLQVPFIQCIFGISPILLLKTRRVFLLGWLSWLYWVRFFHEYCRCLKAIPSKTASPWFLLGSFMLWLIFLSPNLRRPSWAYTHRETLDSLWGNLVVKHQG